MTSAPPLVLPFAARYVLANAHVPAGLAAALPTGTTTDGEGSARLDILIDAGRIAALFPAGHAPADPPRADLASRQVWPAFVDMHTHLDKCHAIPRIQPDGTIQGGFALTVQGWPHWTPEEMTLRMDFALD